MTTHTITCDPADTLTQAGQGPAHVDGLVYGSDEHDAAMVAQAELATLYGQLWTAQVHRLAAEAGVDVTVWYVGSNGAELDAYRMGRDDQVDGIWQAAHDALSVGIRDGRWTVWA